MLFSTLNKKSNRFDSRKESDAFFDIQKVIAPE